MKRNWEKRIEFGGEAEELGERWLAGQKAVFELWHRFKAGTLDRNGLQERMTASIDALGDLLAEGIDSRDAGLSAYCQRLHDRFPMYWLFTSAEGVEPTNNHAGRCCGSRSGARARRAAGSRSGS